MKDIQNVECSGHGMFGLWDVPDVGCSRCGMFKFWDVRDLGCSSYGMFRMCNIQDVGCSECGFLEMWGIRYVGCLPGCGMLIYKMPFCDKDEAHGFEVQALCCGVMNTLSITHLTITFKTAQEYEHVTAPLAGHWQVANSILPKDC